MRKLIIAVMLLCLSSTISYCDTITYDNINSFSDLTVPLYNNNLNKLYTKINTAIDGDNISNQTITSEDLSTAVSPLVRDQENVGEYVYTGMTLPSSGAASSGTVSAGTAYVTKDGDSTLHRVVISTSAAITNFEGYTDDKDNWIYLDYAGNLAISAVGIDAPQPNDLANSIVLGHVEVASGTIQSADESARQTVPPSLRIYQDFVTGLVISRDVSDEDTINIGRGSIDLGTSGKLRRNTATVDIDFDASGADGLAAADTYTAGTFYYIYAYPSDANATNYGGIAGSTTAGVADVDNEKLVGWCYADESSNISADSFGAYKAIGSSAPNIISIAKTGQSSITSTSPVLMPGMLIKFYASGRPVRITGRASVSTSTGDQELHGVLSLDSAHCVGSTTSSTGAANANRSMGSLITEWVGTPTAGTHTADLKWWVAGDTGHCYDRTITIEEL